MSKWTDVFIKMNKMAVLGMTLEICIINTKLDQS